MRSRNKRIDVHRWPVIYLRVNLRVLREASGFCLALVLVYPINHSVIERMILCSWSNRFVILLILTLCFLNKVISGSLRISFIYQNFFYNKKVFFNAFINLFYVWAILINTCSSFWFSILISRFPLPIVKKTRL